MLNERSIVPCTIFYKEIKKTITTRILHIDNVMEYIRTDVSLFCVNNGINYQTFCSHTYQQNSIAESLDIVRTLMIHMHISPLFVI